MLNKLTLVSIIVPVYNTNQVLFDRCVRSVLLQSHENVEVIIVNDGSNAMVAKICDSYLEIDTRVRVIHQQNSGVSSARNRGLDDVKGDYVMFVDSDDLLSKTAVQHMLDSIVDSGADSCTASVKVISDKGTYKFTDNTAIGGAINVSGDEAQLELLYTRSIPSEPFAKLWNYEAISGLRFNETTSIAEDLEFNFFAFKSSDRVIILDEVVYAYREIEGSLSRSTYKPNRADGLDALGRVYENALSSDNGRLIEAAIYRLFMEAIFVMMIMRSSSIHDQNYSKCSLLISSYRSKVMRNGQGKLVNRFVALLSYFSIPLAIDFYRFKKRVGGVLR